MNADTTQIKVPSNSGVAQIFAERMRQIHFEEYTPEHDDNHSMGELTEAAICYATVSGAEVRGSSADEWPVNMFIMNGCLCDWPFESEAYRVSDDPIRNLVKAGALIAAEIDRLERLKNKTP